MCSVGRVSRPMKTWPRTFGVYSGLPRPTSTTRYHTATTMAPIRPVTRPSLKVLCCRSCIVVAPRELSCLRLSGIQIGRPYDTRDVSAVTCFLALDAPNSAHRDSTAAVERRCRSRYRVRRSTGFSARRFPPGPQTAVEYRATPELGPGSVAHSSPRRTPHRDMRAGAHEQGKTPDGFPPPIR
jgi:hypothetical protein